MKAGGKAEYIALPKTASELIAVTESFRDKGIKTLTVGNCSNLLFASPLYSGAVIITSGIKGCSLSEDGIIVAACGEGLSSLASFACANSTAGLEFCFGIPGTVGGGVFMNGGAYGGSVSDVFVSGSFLTPEGRTVTLGKGEMDFGYRKSVLMENGYVLLSASFRGEKGDKKAIRELMDGYMEKRKASQPLEYPSCGSAFKRPEGHYAGALIEQCGLKGFSIGGAQVSEKHAGFIINRSNAEIGDILALIDAVRGKVFSETGITLEPEIRIIRQE